MTTVVVTALAMLAFAGNSVLCRMALARDAIDPASFTAIRILSGAVMLTLLCLPHGRSLRPRLVDGPAAAMLLLYMICFALAYRWLSAGTGALLLFGAVQLTMILAALRAGERPTLPSWLGIGLALGGLVWLVLPGLTAPDPAGALLMAGAGIAWGIYSLLGRSAVDPTASTARNFLFGTPIAAVLMLAFAAAGETALSWAGIALAMASGAVTSGLGYVLWYAVLPRLTAAKAASVQLTVPAITAVLGIGLLGESLSMRLVVASVAILGGVGIVVAQRAGRASAGAGATGDRSDNRKTPA